jgi:predicted Zn-dependent protease
LTRYPIIALFLSLLILAQPSGAERKRISLGPEAGDYSEADIEKEILFGREMASIILSSRKIKSDINLNRYLNLVGQTLLRNASRQELEFHFAAVESDQINAYAAPGGYIFITTAALEQMENEAELAGVIGHEIAHVSERHIVKALKIRADDESSTALLGKVIGSGAETANVLFEQAISQAVEILFSKGLGVEDEFNADKQGVLLTALGGYDPMAYHRFLERIKPIIETRHGEVGSTHPPFADRLTRLKEIIINEGLAFIGKSTNQSRFNQYL